ncbi:MAG: NAD(P)-dependent oxidoreductase [Cyanobacteria bacterium P01_G01_bin.54]
MKTIAILGVGAMGQRLAQRLLAAQHPVIVYNRTPEKTQALQAQGAQLAATPRQAAEQADIVISMVTDDAASRQIWLEPETGAIAGLQANLNKGAIAIESSTLTVAWTKELASKLQQQGIPFLDAPVVGSRPQAEAGQLIYLVGGNGAILAQVQDLLLRIGGAVHHVGANGQGMAMKLAVNALFGIQVAALAEILGLLAQQGLTPADALSCLAELPILSPAAKGAGNLMLAGRHAPLFPIALVAKDFRYALAAGQPMNAAMPTVQAVGEVYQRAIASGYGSDNITGILQLFSSSPVES